MSVPVVGDVCERFEPSLEWRIPNWKSLMNRTYDVARSPSFEFLDATWTLEMMYHLDEISVYVVRNDWEQDYQVVTFKLSARKGNVAEHTILEGEFEFTKGNNQHRSSISEALAQKLTLHGNLTMRCVFYTHRNIASAASQKLSSKCTDMQTGVGRNEDGKRADVKGNQEDFEKLSSDFRDLFLNGKGSDVTLKVQDRQFKAHKAILRARSNVFDSMFTHDMKENISGIVNISDCVPEVFEDFLLYVYCGKVEKISTKNVFDLYETADIYDVVKLKVKCVQFMKDNLSLEIICDVLTLAFRHNESALVEKAKKFFVNNEKKIITGSRWLSFLKDHPEEANELHIKALDKRNFF